MAFPAARRPGRSFGEVAPHPLQHAFQQALLGDVEIREHRAVGDVDVGHDQVIELPAFRGQQNAHLAPVVGIADAANEAAPFQLMQCPGSRGAAHAGALGKLHLCQPVVLPEDAKKLKNPHADAVIGDAGRKRPRHRPDGVGEEKPNRLLEPQMLVASLVRPRGFACACDRQNPLRILVDANMPPAQTIDNREK